ncbi:MAG: repair protein RecO [Verrucomicrobiota bacterium]|jgi:DNA repair protein RecO (recombination protein O)
MNESTSGLILRTRPLTETSLIVHWLTPELGRIATVAKGARRPKSAFHGKLDLFYAGEFSFARSKRSELHALREVVVRNTHERLRHDLGWIQQASYAAALIEQTTESDTPLPEIFALFSGLLDFIPQQPPKPRTVFAFELKLLRELGLEPDLDDSKLSADAQELLAALADCDWPELPALKATTAQARALQQFLHGFLIFHLGKFPRSRQAALAP